MHTALSIRDLDARSAFGREPAPVCPCCDADTGPREGIVPLPAVGAAHVGLPVGTLVCPLCSTAIAEDLVRGTYLRGLDAEDHNAVTRLARRWERRSGRAPSIRGIASVAEVLS